MKYYFAAIVIVIKLSSCAMDYTATAEIENASNTDVRITFYYSKHFLDSAYNGDSIAYRSYIKYRSGRMGMSYKLDTMKLTVTTLVKPGQTLEVAHIPGGVAVEPEYGAYDSIRINTDSKTITRSINQLPAMFKEKQTRLWVWKVEQGR